jgi:hypothetical protein
MKVKVSEATGLQLNWMTCKAAGMFAAYPKYGKGRKFLQMHRGNSTAYIYPTTDWAQGGPILERHISELIDCADSGWKACCNGTYGATGKTALEAVCRAYVASKLGDEVEVPEELA